MLSVFWLSPSWLLLLFGKDLKEVEDNFAMAAETASETNQGSIEANEQRSRRFWMACGAGMGISLAVGAVEVAHNFYSVPRIDFVEPAYQIVGTSLAVISLAIEVASSRPLTLSNGPQTV